MKTLCDFIEMASINAHMALDQIGGEYGSKLESVEAYRQNVIDTCVAWHATAADEEFDWAIHTFDTITNYWNIPGVV